MKRRTFLKFSSAALASAFTGSAGLLSWQPRAYATTHHQSFYITEGEIRQINGQDVYFRGFSRSVNQLHVPGESLIVQQGDTVELTIINTLGSPHRFAIDGLDVDSGEIPAGAEVVVRFNADIAGSFLYHDPSNAPYHRLLGLHGGLAVMPAGSNNELYPGSPTFKQQYFWIFHDVDPVWHARLRDGRTPNTQYEPRFFTLNGLVGRPPGAPGSGDPNLDSMHDPRSALHGHIGDRTLLRILNPGLCYQSVHTHGNHMEWLTENGQIRAEVWEKDCLYLEGNRGKLDAIYPFTVPPDAYPSSLARTGEYPMHLHTEMSQTAAGGWYMFGAITDIFFE